MKWSNATNHYKSDIGMSLFYKNVNIPVTLSRPNSPGPTRPLSSRCFGYRCHYKTFNIWNLCVRNERCFRNALNILQKTELKDINKRNGDQTYRIIEFLLWETTINHINNSLNKETSQKVSLSNVSPKFVWEKHLFSHEICKNLQQK